MGRGNRTKQVFIDPREAFKGEVAPPFPTSISNPFKPYKFDPDYSYEKYMEIREYVINYIGRSRNSEPEMFPFVTEIDFIDDDVIPIAKRQSELLHYLIEELHPLFPNQVNSDKYLVVKYLYKNAFSEEFYRLDEFNDPEEFPLGMYRMIDFLFEYVGKDKSFLDLWKNFLNETTITEEGEETSERGIEELQKVYQRCIEIDEAADDVHPISGVKNLI